MNKILAGLLILIFQLVGMQSAYAFLQEVPGYVGNGSLFVETTSIVSNGNFATLIYVENFEQPQAYGAPSLIDPKLLKFVSIAPKRECLRLKKVFILLKVCVGIY